MQTFAQFALPATILVSAIGAVVLCAVLVLYGFRSDDEEGPSPARRRFVLRLGHAIAAACFAAAMMLGTVALIEPPRSPAAAVSAAPAASSEDVERLQDKITSLEARLAATELRLGDAVQQLAAVESRAASPVPASATTRRAAAVTRRPAPRPAPAAPRADAMVFPATQRELGEAATVRVASSPPPAMTASASASDDLGARMREEWQLVKDGFRQAGEDVRSGFTDVGRRLKRTFGSR